MRINFTKKKVVILFSVIIMVLLVSVGINIYFTLFDTKGYFSYLQNVGQIYIMESGILSNNLEFADGEDFEFSYDFINDEYQLLIEEYGIDSVAGKGTEFEKALRLMNEYSSRLKHKSDYDNSIEMNAISLLEYSLDSTKNGINCRNKAQILNEMCLALGIYSRKVWIMPYSKYDNDCHVVNEIWDSELNKWIMLDITNNEYWVDENGNPLSILEIRYKGAMQEFCTPVHPDDSLDNLDELKNNYMADYLYIMKNMVHMEYCNNYSTGEGSTIYVLCPKNLYIDYEYIISESACKKSPI